MMTETRYQGGGAAGGPSWKAAIQELLKDLREANEKLVAATILAHEYADNAEVAAAALRASEEEMRTASLLRERLMAIVGHDLRSPLNAIALSAELLTRHRKLDAEDTLLVDRIVRTTKRMDQMIRQILEFARARAGGVFTLHLAPIDLRSLCQSIVDEVQLGSPVPIRCELSGDLRGTWDADLLMEVLSNLVGNDVDYASPGTEILVRAIGNGDAVVIEISNQGEPIPPALLPHIFEPFQQGQPGAGAKLGNLGLGLYIAHEIVCAHGGTISAGSAGGTTTFTIRLPRVPAPLP